MNAVYSSRSVEKCVFVERFESYAKVHQNGGSLTGNPTIDAAGLHLDGATQYAIHTIPPMRLAHPEISFECRFMPDFAADDGADHYLFDTSNLNRYTVLKTAANFLFINMGNVGIANIGPLVYAPYWNLGKENILLISSNGVTTDIWLNGNQILTAHAFAWTPKHPTEIIFGARNTSFGSKFDGMINSLEIRARLLTQLDADAIQSNSLYTYPNRPQLYCDFSRVVIDGSNDYAIDLSRFGRTVLLGDGAGTGTPAFQNPGLLFDAVNDYLTLPSDPTGTFTVAWKRGNEPTVFESNLTTLAKLRVAGDFDGLLDYLAWFPFALSPLQEADLSLMWQGGRR